MATKTNVFVSAVLEVTQRNKDGRNMKERSTDEHVVKNRKKLMTFDHV